MISSLGAQVLAMVSSARAEALQIAAERGWATRPVLVSGVGLVFFAALLGAMTISASWSRVRAGLWRYVVGLVISTGAYLVGLFAFNLAFGYSPDLLGVTASSDISDFGADVGIGLLAAALASSVCIELLASVLTGRWSNRFLLLLMLAGCATVAATYVAHLFSRQPWAFFGILLPVGEALFCWVLGQQVWQSHE